MPASSQNQVTPETETAMWDIPTSPPDTTTISTSTQTQPPSKAIQGAPGASWNSKKGHEEYEKAFEKVLDKNWDAKQYGDPLYDLNNRHSYVSPYYIGYKFRGPRD